MDSSGKLSARRSTFNNWWLSWQQCLTCSRDHRTRFLTNELPSCLYFNEKVRKLRKHLEELNASKCRQPATVHPANAGSAHPPLHSSSPTLPVMTTLPATPLDMSPLPPSSPIMSPLSPYLAAIYSSSPLLSLPSPSTSPPTTYSVIFPVITPAGELLDNEKPVFIIIWNQASSTNLQNGTQSLIN